MIPVFERVKIFQALDRKNSVTGALFIEAINLSVKTRTCSADPGI